MALRNSRKHGAAVLLCLTCCHLVQADAVWDKVDAHIRLRQYREAVLILEPLCQRNDTHACRELAQFYRNGLGVARDVAKSAALLKTSADHGDADAQYQLGVMLANGSTGNKDILQARHYLTQAADSGNRKAADYLKDMPETTASSAATVVAGTVPKAERKREPKKSATVPDANESSAAQLQTAAKASGVSALTLAIERGNLALTRQALVAEPDPWEADAQGHTPITRAALYNRPDVLQYLLSQSQGKGQVGANGRTALFHAIDGNSAQSIQPLIAAGISTTKADAKGVTAVEYALQNRSALATTLLTATPKTQWRAEWLPLAAEHGDQAFCLQMINSGISLDATDKRSHTALWHAVSQNNATLAKALLVKGADAFLKDGDGNTLLHVAARHPTSQLADELIPHLKPKNLIDVKNNAGDTALHIASAAGSITTIDHLLAAGANKDLHGNSGNTALMLAVSAHNMRAIDSLIAAGADLNQRNDNKKNALGIAQQLGYHDIETKLQEAAEKQGVMSIFH